MVDTARAPDVKAGAGAVGIAAAPGAGSGVEPASLAVLTEVSPTLEEVQKAYIFWILEKHKWHVPQAAAALGIEPERLQRMTQHYGFNDLRIFQA